MSQAHKMTRLHDNQSVSTSQTERLRARPGGFELMITQLIGDRNTVITGAWSLTFMKGLARWELSPV